MAAIFLDSADIDAIVALVAIEGVVLLAWRARTGGGPPIPGTIANLAAGAFLLLGLREALATGSPETIMALLAMAFVAHIGDLASRWKAATSTGPQREGSASSFQIVERDSRRG